jgi:YVTN family beta-propeller protein
VGVYVTNETGGDLSVIDAGSGTVVATIPLGKRRGASSQVPIARFSTSR